MSETTQAPLENKRTLPLTLMFGDQEICMERIIGKVALLKLVLAGLMDTASQKMIREPLTCPEATELFEIASDVYYALVQNYYAEEWEKSKDEGCRMFI